MERDSISLLHPEQAAAGGGRLDERAADDLDLLATVNSLCDRLERRDPVAGILESLCQDADTIRYRQEVLADLLEDDGLSAGLKEIAPRLSQLQRYHLPREKAELLYEVTWRLGELDSYCECLAGLASLFDSHTRSIRSRALRRLQDYVRTVWEDPVFRKLVEELPGLMSRVRGIASVTVGINLDRDLQPQAAALLQVNKKRFRGPSDTLLGRLFGSQTSGEWEGIAPLHTMPAAGGREERSPYVRPIMVPLFRDLSEVLGRSCRPIASALERYLRLNSRVLAEISGELDFYLGALDLIRRLEASGLPMCRPEIAPAAEGACFLEEGYNLNLALRFAGQDAADLERRIVRNDILIGKTATVFVLTGPNRGGKTTYMQAVGLAQVLAQAGLYVPARTARISPVDGIFSHFPAKEHPELDMGRLGEEARRLRDLFSVATPRSLILLNESLSSTSPAESLVLARDVLRALSRLGARAIYTTHIHELAGEIGLLNRESPGGGRIASLVSLVEEGNAADPGNETGRSGDSGDPADASPPPVRRTFKIQPGTPAGYSHAGEIAAEHGVSYAQLERLLRERGVLP